MCELQVGLEKKRGEMRHGREGQRKGTLTNTRKAFNDSHGDPGKPIPKAEDSP